MSEDFPIQNEPTLRWTAKTSPGRFRRENEDAFLGLTFDSTAVQRLGSEGEACISEGDIVFAVSDGMGGANAGEFASKIAVERITRLLPSSFALRVSGMSEGRMDLLGELMQDIHDEMKAMSQAYEECKGMGATLSLAWFTPNGMAFAHAGDTRIYHLPKMGGMLQVTHDHTHVGWLLRQGKISAFEARFHPQKNRLQMALGGSITNLTPQLGRVICEPGDKFIICSDGVNEGIGDRALEEMVRNPPERVAEMPPADRIIAESITTSKDNLTAMVIEVI